MNSPAGTLIGIALWALIPGFIAQKKGRSFILYYFLSFLISPLITIIITACQKPKQNPGPAGNTPQTAPGESRVPAVNAPSGVMAGTQEEALPLPDPTEYIPDAEPTEYIPDADPTEYIPDAKPTEYNSDVDPTEYIPDADPAEYIPDAEPTEYIPDAEPTVCIKNGPDDSDMSF